MRWIHFEFRVGGNNLSGSFPSPDFLKYRFSWNFALRTWSIRCIFPRHLMHVSSPPCSLCAVGCVYATLNISVGRIDRWHVVVVHNNFRYTVQFYFALSEHRVFFSLLYYNFVQVSTPETWFHFAITGHRIFFIGVYYSSQHLRLTTVNLFYFHLTHCSISYLDCGLRLLWPLLLWIYCYLVSGFHIGGLTLWSCSVILYSGYIGTVDLLYC